MIAIVIVATTFCLQFQLQIKHDICKYQGHDLCSIPILVLRRKCAIAIRNQTQTCIQPYYTITTFRTSAPTTCAIKQRTKKMANKLNQIKLRNTKSRTQRCRCVYLQLHIYIQSMRVCVCAAPTHLCECVTFRVKNIKSSLLLGYICIYKTIATTTTTTMKTTFLQ